MHYACSVPFCDQPEVRKLYCVVDFISVIELVMVKYVFCLHNMYMHHHAYNIEPPRAMILSPDDRLKCLYSHLLMTQTCKINNLCHHCYYWKMTLRT